MSFLHKNPVNLNGEFRHFPIVAAAAARRVTAAPLSKKEFAKIILQRMLKKKNNHLMLLFYHSVYFKEKYTHSPSMSGSVRITMSLGLSMPLG